jgi:hypothetical protein
MHGKATTMDLRQFAYAGVDIWGILSEYTGKTVAQLQEIQSEKKGVGITYEMLAGALEKAAERGGKYYNAMGQASETLAGKTKQLKAEFQATLGELTKSLMPIAKKVVQRLQDIVKWFSKLDDKQKENVLRIGLLVAAIGPLLKVGGTALKIIGTVTTGIGTLTKTIGFLKNGVGTATGTAARIS